MALSITVPALLAGLGVNQYNKMALGVETPDANSVLHHQPSLLDAAVKRAAAIAPNASPLLVDTRPVTPGPNVPVTDLAYHAKIAKPDGTQGSRIGINPNADSAYYAHELGHGVSQKTKIGKFVNDARHKLSSNPKLAKALAAALPAASAITGAALQEGDDDLAASIAIAAAAASPTLVDEALASKNALAIMEDAGLRASLGQRGRLAGGYLSYLAPVLIAGSVGNAVGNVADDYTAIYDL